jgi:hypothetical protein
MNRSKTFKIPFLGCALSAWGVNPVLDVVYHDGYLRDRKGLCAFCHGDQTAQLPCGKCGGGRINVVYPGDFPMEGILLRSFPGSDWSFQHVPHGPRCAVVTWIDQEFAASSVFEGCPNCRGRTI